MRTMSQQRVCNNVGAASDTPLSAIVSQHEGLEVYLRWTPHPVIVATRDSKDNIRVLLYSYYTTVTGWGGPPKVYTKP